MNSAHGWYLRAHQQNLAHHWSGVQHLAIESALSAKIAQPEYWHSAHLAAQLTTTKGCPGDEQQRGWAWGSLTELYLLARLAVSKPMLDEAVKALGELKKLAIDTSSPYLIESTLNQLRRYCQWWTKANGFFPDEKDLAQDAGRLIKLLKKSHS